MDEFDLNRDVIKLPEIKQNSERKPVTPPKEANRQKTQKGKQEDQSDKVKLLQNKLNDKTKECSILEKEKEIVVSE
jgi:hypothetical protein